MHRAPWCWWQRRLRSIVRGWALGTLSTGTMAGTLLGPLIGGVLPGLIGLRETFFLAGGCDFHGLPGDVFADS